MLQDVYDAIHGVASSMRKSTTIRLSPVWRKKLEALAQAERRSISDEAEQLWSEALDHREEVKRFAQKHLKQEG